MSNKIKIIDKKHRVLCIGDIHGSYLALKQVLVRSNFDYEDDLLITIGDIVDGGSDSFMVVEELLKIKNRIDIRGNHDEWFRKFLEYGLHEIQWGMGALATAKSYAKGIGFDLKHQRLSGYDKEAYMLNLNSGQVPESHKIFFKKQINYYKDKNKNLFIHGGFNRMNTISGNLPYTLMWDRHLWNAAMAVKDTLMNLIYEEDFNQIFIGHTSTLFWGTDKPIKADKIWNLDTGAGGSNGKLTIMDIETNEFWQSDLVGTLYPKDK